jgi:hypothetical protein
LLVELKKKYRLLGLQKFTSPIQIKLYPVGKKEKNKFGIKIAPTKNISKNL